MTESRRAFLRRTAAATTGILVVRNVPILAAPSTSAVPEPSKRLLFGPEDLPRIRKNLNSPRFSPFWKSLLDADLAADRKFLLHELRLNNHSRDILQARLILERTAFVYAITGDSNQLEIARLAIRRLLEYKRWDYFLEGGTETIGLQRAPETTIAMVCAYEWLGGALSGEEKDEIRRQIGEKGAPPCFKTLYGMKYPDRVRGWGFDPEDDYQYRFDLRRWPLILNSTNLKIIPVAGLGLAACFLRGEHPMADRWLDMAISSARAFSVMFGRDGSYDEGVGYWGYTALHLALLADVVHRVHGIDLRDLINFRGTVKYGLQMSMPATNRPMDCVNFGDAWSMGDVSIAAWTAREFRDPIAQFVATRVGEIRNYFAAIWLDPDIEVQEPGDDLKDVRFTNDVVVSRTSWDATGSVVALRSGGPANHEHADRNSVLFKAYGERFFHDPYKAAYSHTDVHWKLRLTPSHTALLIDGKGHQYHDGSEGTNASWAEATVLRHKADAASMIVTSDATVAYKLVHPGVTSVLRTLIFLKPDTLILVDSVEIAGSAHPVQIRFQIDNSDGGGSGTTDNSGFTIRRPTAVARATCAGSGSLVTRIGKIELPAEMGDHPFLEVESAAALAHTIITAVSARPGKDPAVGPSITRKGNVWSVAGRQAGSDFTVTIDLGKAVPAVDISKA